MTGGADRGFQIDRFRLDEVGRRSVARRSLEAHEGLATGLSIVNALLRCDGKGGDALEAVVPVGTASEGAVFDGLGPENESGQEASW